MESSKFLQDQVEAEFEDLKTRWDNFIDRFEDVAPGVHGIKNNVFYQMVTETRAKEKFVEMARETRPFISKELWDLLENFMEFMRNLPDPEGANYRVIYKAMSPAGLVKRLITKRPIVFLESSDDHILRKDPILFKSGDDHWNAVAQTLEKERDNWPYLREYISYDEILLAACVNMSTPTYFVSDGSLRNNSSKPSRPFIPQGILCGLVGARLEKETFMEHRFVFPRDLQDKNYDSVHHSDGFWIENVYQEAFPEGKIPSLEEVNRKPETYENIYVNGINIKYLKKRLAMPVIPFIQEAVNRGREKKVQVVASVPPIGAGVWKGNIASKTIVDLIVTGVLEYLDNIFEISDLDFLVAIFLPQSDPEIYKSYSPLNNISSIKVSSTDSSVEVYFKSSPSKVLTIFNLRRYVAQLLPPKFSSALIVAGYAWDGNSYPGNEYWIDSFGSFDPQAILCSNLGQFQNPEVNVKLADPERIKFF